MASKTVTLKNNNGDQIHPKTKANAVFLEDGQNVESKFKTIFSGSYNDLTDKPELFSGSYNDLTDKPVANNINYSPENSEMQANNVQDAIDELFTFASDGKKKCAQAVTGMGVSTAENATFDTIAENIKKIETGPDTSQLTASPSNVRSGYKFIGSAGTVQTGTISSKSTASYYPSISNQIINSGVYLTGSQTFYGLNLGKVVITNSDGGSSTYYRSRRKIQVDYRGVGQMTQIKQASDTGFLMIQFRDGDNAYADPLLLVLYNGVGSLYPMYGSDIGESSTFSISSWGFGGLGSSANNVFNFTIYDSTYINNGMGTSTSGYIDNFIWVPNNIYQP